MAILLFKKLIEHCNNDCVMFVRYVSFDMRINNKTLFELEWKELELLLIYFEVIIVLYVQTGSIMCFLQG